MRGGRLAAALLALLAGAGTVEGSSEFDPALRFRRLTTQHFFIYYHQGEEQLALRLATIAEGAREDLARSFTVPRSRTHVVLVDQTELANGWATPVPYNTIVINAAWPAGSDLTGHVDDWLRSVFVHEFTHIAHLDRSNHWARLVRGAFGRVPLAFPNLFLPTWEIEGVATLLESRLTGRGRLYAADFGAIVEEAARHGSFEPLDRLNGGVTDWPGADAPYAYGLEFHAYLAERFGLEALDALAEDSAASIPYAGSFAFQSAFGLPLGTLFKDYLASIDRTAEGDGSEAAITRHTWHGFATTAPRFLPSSCTGCPAQIGYTAKTPHEFPSIQVLSPDGGTPRRLTSRYLGATFGATRSIVVFDQQELHRNAGLYSDLYVLDRVTERVAALTREARLLDPDVSADGKAIVAVQQGPGQRALVLLELSDPDAGQVTAKHRRTIAAEPTTQFTAPRWSPDGSLIVAERHRLGALPELVIVDGVTGSVRVLASSATHRFVTPTWHPEGLAVVAAADLDGTFNLHEFPVEGGTPRQLTFVRGGATWPDVSPDGRTIAFIGYTRDGFDVFTTAYPQDSVTPASASSRYSSAPLPSVRPTESQPTDNSSDILDLPYRPWGTLRPTYWAPVATFNSDQLRLGALTGGYDVLQYHGFAAEVTWLIDVAGRDPSPRPAAPDWDLYYVYRRWRPTFFGSASHTTTLISGLPDDTGFPVVGSVQEHALESGIIVPARTVRASRQWLFAGRMETLDSAIAEARDRDIQHAFRAGWSRRSALEYGYSISPEDGTALGLTLDWRPDVSGSAVTTVSLDGRGYLPGILPNHVVAVRGAAGLSMGPRDVRRPFFLGATQASAGTLDFDRDALGLLRGFGARHVASSRVAVGNAEYRWPLTRPQRGMGTLPLLLHTVHASVFVDGAYAWDDPQERELYASLGGELSFNLVAGYRFPLTVTLGGAWTRSGVAPHTHGGALFGRIGRSF